MADSASTTLFAYTLSNGNRNTGTEITLANPARGVWGNSTTIWAVNETTDKLEAYQKSDGTDDNDKDITLDSANADPAGIWSDDTTIWVADHVDDKLYAYTLSGGARDMTKEIDTSTSGNENPRGLWGEGDTIWVTDEDDDRVYSYNLQDQRSSDATLSALITSPRNILRFDADRTAYEVGVASTVAQATVTATANDAKASVDYSGTDADLVAVGHQVDLSTGRNEVTVTVTAEKRQHSGLHGLHQPRGHRRLWLERRERPGRVGPRGPRRYYEHTRRHRRTQRHLLDLVPTQPKHLRFPTGRFPPAQPGLHHRRQPTGQSLDGRPDTLGHRSNGPQVVRPPALRRQPPDRQGIQPAQR